MARAGDGARVGVLAATLTRSQRLPAALSIFFFVFLVGGCNPEGEPEEDETGEGDFICQAVCRLPDGTLEPGGSRRFPGFGEDEAQQNCEAPLTGGVDLCRAPAAFASQCTCTEEPEDEDLRVPLR
jgi:hypothetical protein